jgi:flagellar biosynthesis protein FlhF
MRIKRYEAATIQEALQKVKKDLGPEAVILYTKTFRKGGVLGLFGKPMAEITAGVELNLMDDVAKRRVAIATPAPVSPKAPLESILRTVAASGAVDPQYGVRKALQRDLNEMKTTVSAPTAVLKDSAAPILSEVFARFRKKMLRQEVEEFILQRMVQGMLADRVDPEKDEETIAWMTPFIEKSLKIAPPPAFGGVTRVAAFVGPTGVGKTTTLAKLAARYSLVERKRVVMVTADTYRIAATEQLKTYGRIMGVPVEIANTADEMPEIIAKHQGVDWVLLDTAGRSPTNEDQMSDLKQFVFKSQPDETHLVLSATTKYLEMLRIVERFGGAVPLNRLIFTKMDETKYYGALLNLMMNFQIPLSFCATGQNVPDDLEIPEPSRLAETVSRALVA